jgi:hypothetical protein
LALGLGLLLGGTLGEEVIVKEQVQMLDQLEALYTRAKDDNTKLHKQSTELRQRTSELEQMMNQMGHHYVQDRLAGKKIAILHMEPLDLSPLLTVLQKAGAEVTSTMLITNTNGLLDRATVAGLDEAIGVDAKTDQKIRQQRLADALVRDLFFPSEQTVLEHLQETKSVTVNGILGSKPDAVVLVGGASEKSVTRLQQFDLPLLRALKSQDVNVIATEASAVQRSAIRYYRDYSVSTVDNIDQVTGMIALIDVLSGAKGHYGVKKSAEALLPKSTTAKEVIAP